MRTEWTKVLLAGVQTGNQQQFDYAMEELAQLAYACELETSGQFSQKTARPHPSTYFGSGKLEELRALLAAHDYPDVVFNDELSPSQIRNLESALQCRIIDRTMLILEIFSRRAKTREAQLQVEVARLQYMLPRLVGSRQSLGRQGGGSGLKNRGAGETKLELDRRRALKRIATLSAELEKLAERRHLLRKQRRHNEVPVVCLVGYTNAGKSSMMNALLKLCDQADSKQVFAHDMLFATLETRSRGIQLPGNRSLVVTDTVGFVDRLPHHLVKAFRSTLEEVAEADLLLHVVDVANPDHERHIQVTRDTLRELGADHIQELLLYNKADLTNEPYPRVEEEAIYLSAGKAAGLEELTAALEERLFNHYARHELLVPYHNSHIVAYLQRRTEVAELSYEEEGTRMVVLCDSAELERYKHEVQIL